jgi:hypothetical protein
MYAKTVARHMQYHYRKKEKASIMTETRLEPAIPAFESSSTRLLLRSRVARVYWYRFCSDTSIRMWKLLSRAK